MVFNGTITGTSAPCTSVFKPVWFGGGLPAGPAPGKRYDPSTLWWRHELLHRATLQNYPERIATFAKLRDDLEAQFLTQAATAPDRGKFTAECFAASDAMIGISEFIRADQLLAVPIWWAYAVAQLLITAGFFVGRRPAELSGSAATTGP